MFRESRASHVYVARKSCGCVAGLVSDYADRTTGKAVCEFIASGLTVTRETFEYYKSVICHEAGFMGCIHRSTQTSFLGDSNV